MGVTQGRDRRGSGHQFLLLLLLLLQSNNSISFRAESPDS